MAVLERELRGGPTDGTSANGPDLVVIWYRSEVARPAGSIRETAVCPTEMTVALHERAKELLSPTVVYHSLRALHQRPTTDSAEQENTI
jgi:hypothetical protein